MSGIELRDGELVVEREPNELGSLAEKRERNRERRVESIKRWVRYIEENPPEKWGEQQNRLVNSQLESAREADLPAEHYRRVERSGDDGTG